MITFEVRSPLHCPFRWENEIRPIEACCIVRAKVRCSSRLLKDEKIPEDCPLKKSNVVVSLKGASAPEGDS